MKTDETDDTKLGWSEFALSAFTVSAIYDDGLEAVIVYCMAADAQAARDQVIMERQGLVIIASVFAGHLTEPDAVVFRADTESPEEAAASDKCM